MTQLNSTSLREIFQEALKEDKDFIKELLERLLQEFMEEERDEQVGAWVQVASAISSFGIIYQKKGVAHVPISPIKC